MKLNKHKHHILAYVIISTLFLLILYSGAFSYINNVLADNIHSKDRALQNIVIIEIDDASINEIGRWPWNRQVYVPLMQQLVDAKAVGIDISFFEPSQNDSALANVFSNMDSVVLASEISSGKLYKPVFNTSTGYVNLMADSDGKARKVLFDNAQGISPFAFELYKKSWNPSANLEEGVKRIGFANFDSSYISFSEALKGEYDFAGKIVLIGASAQNLHDNYFVPVSEGTAMNGVEIHANILQNLILDSFIEEQSKNVSALMILLLGGIGMFVFSRVKVQYAILLNVFVAVMYIVFAITMFRNFDYLAEVFLVPLAPIVYTGIGLGVNYLSERNRNKFVTGAFGKYISKDLLNEILAERHSLNLGGVKRRITIFFSDIRGFTSLSEKLPPKKLVQLINSYLTEMTGIILRSKGTVDKFIGDAIMAFWNAPLDEKEHEVMACRSAIEQVKHLSKMNDEWENKGLPRIAIGCGLHTGDAIVGNMGSHDRFDYTALGDSVNLASRLEGLTKEYGVSIIVSEETYRAAKHAFTFRKLDKVKVKGKKVPIAIYELCIDCNPEFISCFENALSLYFSQSFAQAKKEFKRANSIKKDHSAEMFIERCDSFIKKSPGHQWDGAWVMKTK